MKKSEVEDLLHPVEREAAARRYRRRRDDNRLKPRGDEPAHVLKYDEHGVAYIERHGDKKLDHDMCNLLELRNFAERAFEHRLDSLERKYKHLKGTPPDDPARKPYNDAMCQAIKERMGAIHSFEAGLDRARRAYEERMKQSGEPLPEQRKPDWPNRRPASKTRPWQVRAGD